MSYKIVKLGYVFHYKSIIFSLCSLQDHLHNIFEDLSSLIVIMSDIMSDVPGGGCNKTWPFPIKEKVECVVGCVCGLFFTVHIGFQGQKSNLLF